MKKIIACLTVLAAMASAASAQDIDYLRGLELNEGKKVKTSLKAAFPMQFGMSSLMNISYNSPRMREIASEDMLATSLPKSFFYSFELLGINFSSAGSPVEVNLGLRFSFLDIAFKRPDYTFREREGEVIPILIRQENPDYNSGKSKVHANYIGVPLRFIYNVDKVKFHAGASAEYLIKGYTKYKAPSKRSDINGLFNSFRGTVEGGITYGPWGIYVNYALTPVFDPAISNANTFTVGLSFVL